MLMLNVNFQIKNYNSFLFCSKTLVLEKNKKKCIPWYTPVLLYKSHGHVILMKFQNYIARIMIFTCLEYLRGV